MIKFVFATHNEHKVLEVIQLLKGWNMHIQTLSEMGIHAEIVEDGTTLKENALIKANFIYRNYGGNVISDDSGLEIDGLEGKPGVFSARYAGAHKSSEDNMRKVLKELDNVEDRSAQFRTVLAVWLNDKQFTVEGIVRGKISREASGSGGFGYDPIFIPEGFDQSFGSLSPKIKNTISHRVKAIESFKHYVRDHFDIE